MEAGRELDALVAEKVMGWTERAMGGGLYFQYDGDVIECPYFSTDIAAAWQVAEAMIGKGYHVQLDSNPEMGRWEVNISEAYGAYKPVFTATTPSAPLAICLAALKSVGIKIDHFTR